MRTLTILNFQEMTQYLNGMRAELEPESAGGEPRKDSGVERCSAQ